MVETLLNRLLADAPYVMRRAMSLKVKYLVQVNSLLWIHRGGREGDVALPIALFAAWGLKDRYDTGATGTLRTDRYQE